MAACVDSYDTARPALPGSRALSDNPEYGKNRALLNWYYIDRFSPERNSSLCPGYLKSDVDQQSNPYVREVTLDVRFSPAVSSPTVSRRLCRL